MGGSSLLTSAFYEDFQHKAKREVGGQMTNAEARMTNE
jgi:hypothetical protein